jgi:DNA-binding Lrp family transcriptional regulator
MYYYAERKSYIEIADRQNMSERSCRRMVREATRKMALMMFGLKSKENIIFVH